MGPNIEVSISCRDCVRRHTPDCADCLVSFVLGGEPEHLEMSGPDADVVALLTNQGMMPHLRYQRDTSASATSERDARAH